MDGARRPWEEEPETRKEMVSRAEKRLVSCLKNITGSQVKVLKIK